MKKSVLLILCLYAMINTSSARIVEISRTNGLFGFYGDLDQTYMGMINGQEWWVLNCQNPGFVRCKLRPTAGKTVSQNEVEEIENAKLSDLMLSIENEDINSGHTSGEKTKHYQSTLSDNSVVDIYVTISWKPDPSKSGNTSFHATLNNSIN